MASYDPYEIPARERTTKRYVREVSRDDRDPRYATRETYVQSSRDLIPSRPSREDSDLSIEEIRRDFPPPGASRGDIYRSRSPGGYYDDYDRESHYNDRDRDYDRRSHKKTSTSSIYYEEDQKKKARILGKQEQIIAALAGAAIAIGSKEVYDRRAAKGSGSEVNRNVLASAALGAAGAFAGYQGTELYNKRMGGKEEKRTTTTHMVAHKGRDGKIEYYSEEEETAKEKKGHKNFLEAALAAAGLGGAVKALTGKDDKSDTKSRRGSSRSTSRSRSRSRSRSKDDKGGGANKIQKAAMASLIAGATEAFRISKEPGSWKGEKAKRVLTAAAGAATIDAAQNPDKAGSKLGLAEAVIGGLVGNRVLNGSKKNIEEDVKTGRSRSRSRARSQSGGDKGSGGGVSGLAALATAGLGAFGAKKLMDNHEERSRSRRRSVDSYDSRDGSPKRHRSRSRSVVDKARKGLANLGIGNGPESDDDRRGSSRRRGTSRRDSYDDSDYDRDRDRDRRGKRDDDDRSHRSHSKQRGATSRRGSISESDLGDSDEDNKRAKKMRGKQVLTTGLAAVATIHAAHSVYASYEKRNKRQKAVREGKLSPEEAKKLKTKAILQDAASVGIAALGIKGAISELKEAREMTHEMREWKHQKAERHERRLAKQLQLTSGDGDRGSDGDDDSSIGFSRRRADSWSPAPPRRAHSMDGPRYVDGNPYAVITAPSVGVSERR
ncbi:hypothetical protein B0H63DRAFT_49920 [Podospora didyma]|uniref:DUF3824 domain-containing protein n=1 Tax=Podospora didyma TaxID=330526 RepID=A0AAE0P759_9PEZI|nr:hypothetical protein B0H63DRAFT_49920 [Podospora didyma]